MDYLKFDKPSKTPEDYIHEVEYQPWSVDTQ